MLRFPRPGFTDPAISMSWDIEPDAFHYLPEITAEDQETTIERFRLLAGKWTTADNHVEVLITDVVEIPHSPEFYEEKPGSVAVNLAACLDLANRNLHVEGTWDREIIGEFHTHPVLSAELDHRSWHPSMCDELMGDVQEWTQAYTKGILNPAKPFIFLIGGLMETLQTGYSAYRMIQKGDQWKAVTVTDVMSTR